MGHSKRHVNLKPRCRPLPVQFRCNSSAAAIKETHKELGNIYLGSIPSRQHTLTVKESRSYVSIGVTFQWPSIRKQSRTNPAVDQRHRSAQLTRVILFGGIELARRN